MRDTKVNVEYFEPQSLDWFAARKENVTGTEVACLLGLDKYKNPTKLLQSKLDNTSEIVDNIYMRAGRFLEPAVIAELRNCGIPAQPVHESMVAFIKHPDLPLSVSLDGKALYNGRFYIVECKTCSYRNHTTGVSKFDEWKAAPPISYYIQVQAQMYCANAKRAILACVEAIMPFPIIAWEIEADTEVQEIIKEEVLRFYDCYNNNKRFIVNKDNQRHVIESVGKKSTIILI